MKCIGYVNPASGNQDIYMANLVVDSFIALKSLIIVY